MHKCAEREPRPWLTACLLSLYPGVDSFGGVDGIMPSVRDRLLNSGAFQILLVISYSRSISVRNSEV